MVDIFVVFLRLNFFGHVFIMIHLCYVPSFCPLFSFTSLETNFLHGSHALRITVAELVNKEFYHTECVVYSACKYYSVFVDC